MPERAHPLGREPEQRSDADELRERLLLQLAQLRELAGLDELPQACFDPGADPGELADAARAHERVHVGGSRPDQLGRAAVRAHRVVARPVQVEQRREGLETLGESRVFHRTTLYP